MGKEESKYHKLRFIDIVNLAAPSTWAASVMPSIFAIALAYKMENSLDIVMAVCLFIIAILMQSSVNTLNDYADYVKGTDTLDNSPDSTDAVIVYGLKPKTARNVGIMFLAIALIPGLYTVYMCGYVPLVIGIIGGLVIVAYSLGKLPISYLPLGELVSGFVMGGLIPLAGFYMQTRDLNFMVLFMAIPIIFGIGMIMFSNNSCDIEKDIPAGRHTLPVLMGRKKTNKIYPAMVIIWILTPVVVFLVIGSFRSVLIYVLQLSVMLFGIMRQYSFEPSQEQRGMIMGGIANLNIMLAFSYMISILLS